MAKDKGKDKDKDKKKKKKDKKKDKQWVHYDDLQFHPEKAPRQSPLLWGFLLFIVKVFKANCQVTGIFSLDILEHMYQNRLITS